MIGLIILLANFIINITITIIIIIITFISSITIIISVCNRPLGMEDGRITDSQITASSYHSRYYLYEPRRGRLNEYYLSWASNYRNTNQWIKVTFDEVHYITGVITQGYDDAWVTSYKVAFTEDGTNWQYVTGTNGQDKVCMKSNNLDQNAKCALYKYQWVVRLQPSHPKKQKQKQQQKKKKKNTI